MDLVVVTGGSRGLGAALLRRWPDRGRTTRVVVARHEPAEPVAPDGSEPVTIAADLADPAAWPDLHGRLRDLLLAEPWERVAFVHAAATLDPIGFAGEVDASDYARQAVLNAAAPLAVGDGFLRALGEMPRPPATAVLVQVTSGAATGVYPGWSSYCGGKAAVDQWVRVVGEEQRLRGTSTRVLSIAPGVVATEMQARIRTTDEADFPRVERFRELHASGALADADEVAATMWRVALEDDTPTGAVLDVRQLGRGRSHS